MHQPALIHTDRARLIKMIEALADIFAVEMTDTRVQAYVAALADIPTDDLAAGCRRAVRVCVYMPKPVELRRAVDAEVATRVAVQPFEADVVSEEDGPTYACPVCEDTGYRYHDGQGGRVISIAEAVARGGAGHVSACPCRPHNPTIRRRLERARRRYAEDKL